MAEFADLNISGTVTIFGANGGVQIVGVADADTVSLAFSDEHTIVEQHNSRNVVTGAVAHNQRSDVTLTFYPLPSAAATSIGSTLLTVEQTEAAFRAIEMPTPLATVYVVRRTSTTGPDQLPTSVAGGDAATYRKFSYVGGGTQNYTSTGLMTMTLPLRRWAAFAPA